MNENNAVDYGAQRWRPHEYARRDAPDPHAPNVTVRRAQRVYPYSTWWKEGRLTDAEHEAAERYTRWAEIAAGARWRPDSVGQSSYFRMTLPAEAQLGALQGLRHVEEACGDLAPVLRLVGCGATLDRLALTLRVRRTRALPMARDALARAAEHWQMTC